MTSSRLRALLPDAPPTEGNHPRTVSGHPSQPITQQGTKQRAPRRRRKDTRGHIRLNQALVTSPGHRKKPEPAATRNGNKQGRQKRRRTTARRRHTTNTGRRRQRHGDPNSTRLEAQGLGLIDRDHVPRGVQTRQKGTAGTKSRGCENDPLRMQRTHRPYQAEGHGTTHAGADGAPQDGRVRGETS